MAATGAISVAELVVTFLVARNVDRVFGLQGGHVQPIWDSWHSGAYASTCAMRAPPCTWPTRTPRSPDNSVSSWSLPDRV